MSNAKEKITKKTLKKICIADSNGNICGGLLKEVLDKKLSTDEFEKKRTQILEDYYAQTRNI